MMGERFTPTEVVHAAAALYGCEVSRVRMSDNCHRRGIEARELICAVLHEQGYSFPEIALYLGRPYRKDGGSSECDATQRFKKRSRRWQQVDLADLADHIHNKRKTNVCWTMTTNDPAMMLYRLADLLIAGKVAHRAAGLALQELAHVQHTAGTPYRLLPTGTNND